MQSYFRVGDARRVLADKPGAISAYNSALKTARELTKTDTNNVAWQMNLSVCYCKLGAIWLEEGGAEVAMTPCQTSLKIAQQFADQDPANSEWQSALADSHDNLGDVLLARKKTKEASKHYEDALQIRRGLADNDPADTRWQRGLLRSHFNIASAQAYARQGSKQLKAFLAGWKPVVNLTKMPVDVEHQLFTADSKSSKPLETVQRTMDDARQLPTRIPATSNGRRIWAVTICRGASKPGELL